MKNNKIIWRVLKRTGTDKLLYGYICLFTMISIIIMIIEPNINNIGDSIWYCFSVMSTIGFGDISAVTPTGRVLSIVLSLYSILIVGIIPGVLTSYYIESTKLKANESMEKFLYDLERLPELSKEELEELSKKVINFQDKRHK